MANGEQLTLNHKERLLEQLKNADYRRGFIEGHAKDTIAFQLRTLRKAMEWEQRDVAERLGNAKLQPMISRYENPDYGRYSISTLLELAAVFDVALVVRFAPFSELVGWDWSSDAVTLCPASFEDDVKLAQLSKQIEAEKRLAAQIQSHIRTAETTQNQQSKANPQTQNPLGEMATGNAGSAKAASAA